MPMEAGVDDQSVFQAAEEERFAEGFFEVN